MSRPRRHHHLPLFLITAFKIKDDGCERRVRVLRKTGVFETAAKNVGLEKDFHSELGPWGNPELLLSRREGEFAEAMRRWTPGRLDSRDATTADDLVGHLRLRTRVMRELGRLLVEPLIADGANAYAQAVRASKRPAPMSLELADIVSKRLVGVPEALLVSEVERHLMPIIHEHIADWLLQEAARIGGELLNERLAGEMLAALHTHLILMQVLNRNGRRTLPDWHWKVIRTETPLLLGDFGPISVARGTRRLTSFNAEAMESSCAVLLPIAPRMLLMGSESKRFRPPSPMRLNEAIVTLSYDFVIGVQSRQWLERQKPRLGEQSDHHSPSRALGIIPPDAAATITEMVRHVRAFVVERIKTHTTARAR